MKKNITKDDLMKHKSNSIQLLDSLIEEYILSGTEDDMKKAFLLSKWIKDYAQFVGYENQFSPAKNISYKRGNIIKANFGFNIGSELGGVHYAVVLDNDNKHHSNTITVIPLSSYKEGKPIYERDLLIGNEFFILVSAKYDNLMKDASERYAGVNELLEMANSTFKLIKASPSSDEATEQLNYATKFLSDMEDKRSSITNDIQMIKNGKSELQFMKKGSIAKIEQITTISKMRIWNPKKTVDALYGISFSENTMEKINSRVKELYTFS